MWVIADISIVPLGVGLSLSPFIAECERILRECGLEPRLHAYGTNVEGEWEDVFGALRRCHERLHEMGVPRVSTNLRCGTRTDRRQRMEEKIRAVERRLGEEPGGS